MRGSSLNISSEMGGEGVRERASTATADPKYVCGWYRKQQEASDSKSRIPCITPPFEKDRQPTAGIFLPFPFPVAFRLSPFAFRLSYFAFRRSSLFR